MQNSNLLKSNLIILLLSFIYPGLGHSYLGRLGKSIIFSIIGFASILLNFISLRIFQNFYITIWVYIIVWGVSIIDVINANIKTNKEDDRNNQNSTSKFIFGIIITVLSIFSGFVLGNTYLNSKYPGQLQLETYLNNKFNKEFTVKKAELYWNENGVKGYNFTISPKDNLELEFENDQYLQALWANEAEAELSPIVNKLFKNDTYFYAIIQAPLSLIDKISGIPPSYKEAKQKYSDEFNSDKFYEYIKIVRFMNLSNDGIYTETQSIFDTISYAKENQTENLKLDINYFVTNDEDETRRIIQDIGIRKFVESYHSIEKKFRKEEGIKLIYTCSITRKDIKEIKEPKDIKRFFRKANNGDQ